MESERINSASGGGRDGLQRMRPLQGRTIGPARRSTKGQWTADEDEVLRNAVQRFKGKNWKKIAECFKDRTDVQCLHRWQKVLNPELVKGPWSKEEDEIMIELVNKYGPKKWSTISQHLPGRIGKQCRERWHNHLNPSINKDAWTQEEELILIRAHQIYGNKWAELTKFLPGRSDNAIKNQWNSSVKKKLNSYLASGLLTQLQGLPHVNDTSQSMPSSSLTKQQSSGDDSVLKDQGTEADEISECSEGSSAIAVLPSATSCVREECQLTNESSHGRDPSFSPALCYEKHNENIEVAAFPRSGGTSEMDGSFNFVDHSYSYDGGSYTVTDWKINPNELPNVSPLDLGKEIFTHCIGVHENHELMPFPSHTAVSLNASPSMYKPEHMISEDDCYRVIYPEVEMDGHFLTGNFTQCSNITDFNGPSASLLYQQLNYQIPDYSRSDMLGASCSQRFAVPAELPPDDGANLFVSDLNEFNDISVISHRSQQEELAKSLNGIIYCNDYVNSPCEGGEDNMGPQDEPDQAKDSLKVAPVDVFSSMQSSCNNQTSSLLDEKVIVSAEEKEKGSLCYEPPRFPSLDIPFFSCDIIQTGDDVQQEYSPLGIRQLMMSSVNCFSPFRLWDSPTRDGSPDAVLKSAAKTFTCTLSILKKRNRDLISPMSEKRSEKKLETDTNQELFSNLARDFSRIDVRFCENVSQKAPLLSLPSHAEDKTVNHTCAKENMNNDSKVGKADGKDSIRGKTISGKDIDKNNFQDEVKAGTAGVNGKTKGELDAVTKNVPQPLGILVEHNINDMLFFSPDRFGIKSDNITFGNQCSKRLDCTSIQGSLSESSSGNPRLSVVVSPVVSAKKDKSRLIGAVSGRSAYVLNPSETIAGSSGNDTGVENLSIFGETPFKRSIESPSAWKSPWFINSFLPGPRVDTDITIEDIGYFMSPGDRSLDAIGLMKQISEHNANAFADAQEVLGDETPETILKGRRSKDLKLDQKNSSPRNQPATNSLLASNVLAEKRVLDFSDCGTPGKDEESSKTSTSMNFSSPSSYLLKSCR